MGGLEQQIAQNNEAIAQKFQGIDLSKINYILRGREHKQGIEAVLEKINQEMEEIRSFSGIDEKLEAKNAGYNYWDANIESPAATELRYKELISLQESILALEVDGESISEEALSSLQGLHDQVDEVTTKAHYKEGRVLAVLEKALAEKWTPESGKEQGPFYQEFDDLTLSLDNQVELKFADKGTVTDWTDETLLHYRGELGEALPVLSAKGFNVLWKVLSSNEGTPISQEDFSAAIILTTSGGYGTIFRKILRHTEKQDSLIIPVESLKKSYSFTADDTDLRKIVEQRTENTNYEPTYDSFRVFMRNISRHNSDETLSALFSKYPDLNNGESAEILSLVQEVAENPIWFLNELDKFTEHAPLFAEMVVNAFEENDYYHITDEYHQSMRDPNLTKDFAHMFRSLSPYPSSLNKLLVALDPEHLDFNDIAVVVLPYIESEDLIQKILGRIDSLKEEKGEHWDEPSFRGNSLKAIELIAKGRLAELAENKGD